MSESLRDRVTVALLTYLDTHDEWGVPELLDVTFEVLAGARPCVTCGKSIGPNKVARGYVQCYGCTHTSSTTTPVVRAVTSNRTALELADAPDDDD